MRIDAFLCGRGITQSRNEAKSYIQLGAVTVNGKTVTKPSQSVSDTDVIEVDKSKKKYVSRGGLKLEGALSQFGIDVQDALAIDVGASSGGFTDCLLQNGAKHVICVDSGTNQLVDSIRGDDRVTAIENFNARYMTPEDLEYAPNLAVMDVSFISATYIILPLYQVLASGADFICLIKPQFEVGRENIGKGGIVKDDKARMSAVKRVTEFAEMTGFKTVATIKSPIVGGDGNIEFLAHFKKEEK